MTQIKETGIELIAKERQRQVEKEGWSSEHDDKHNKGELAKAAACYCICDDLRESNRNRKYLFILRYWKFSPEFWKPSQDNRIKELAKAGALIAAEIDRLQRLPS